MPDQTTSNRPEMRLQFAAVIERRFQCRSKPEIEGRSNIGCDSVRSKVAEVTLISTRGIPLGLCAILPRESTRSLEKRQHVDQFKAPADIRRAARPAELIALRALARRGVSELAPVPGLI